MPLWAGESRGGKVLILHIDDPGSISSTIYIPSSTPRSQSWAQNLNLNMDLNKSGCGSQAPNYRPLYFHYCKFISCSEEQCSWSPGWLHCESQSTRPVVRWESEGICCLDSGCQVLSRSLVVIKRLLKLHLDELGASWLHLVILRGA